MVQNIHQSKSIGIFRYPKIKIAVLSAIFILIKAFCSCSRCVMIEETRITKCRQYKVAAEQKARTTYDNILRLVKDPEVCEPIKFLRAREIVHFQRFGETKPTRLSIFLPPEGIPSGGFLESGQFGNVGEIGV